MFKRLITTLMTGILGLSAPAGANEYGEQAREDLLLDGLRALRENRLEAAAQNLRALTDQRPDFRLAQLIYGDLMLAHSEPLQKIGSERVTDARMLDGLISEARVRLLTEAEKPAEDMIPSALLKLADDQRYVVVMDTRLSRLFLFENHNGIPRLVEDYYASYGRGGVGKEKQGDLKTPLGVYFVTGRIPDAALPSKYGSGALPLNYPNAWDKRLKRTGNGIWLHGSPVDSYSRPPLASEGCISLSNPDFLTLDRQVDIRNTPVIVGENINWMRRDDWLRQREQFSALIEQWRQSWQSLDNARYLSHYSTGFNDGRYDYNRFVRYKSKVNAAKSYIDVELTGLSLFRYPDQPELMVATFNQHYRSDNHQSDSIKRQYWRLEQGRWKIAYEGKPSKGLR
ncbi:L,D-transpeptidase family protein [Marinobacterium arenosum]|uniref:L,D-transpeptidase family protein n=1 Tax=Marinobacterium arenosum TaxID=2862496 RepID=UPI001C94131A|nr:L,D-transpeptidase family protein [Marinobacterium arenosum]MBY4675999.1 L,D-transpeptidase family protein [Marinobacterium arenosum]